jgi:hypothetical protein
MGTMWMSIHLWKTRASLRTDMDVRVNSEETENESLSPRGGWGAVVSENPIFRTWLQKSVLGICLNNPWRKLSDS